MHFFIAALWGFLLFPPFGPLLFGLETLLVKHFHMGIEALQIDSTSTRICATILYFSVVL